MVHRPRTVLAALAILICVLPAKLARADAYCGAGRHVGSENGDGAGQSWVCTPDRPSASFSPSNIPSGVGGNNAAAAMQGAAAGLQGLAALLDIANQLGSMIQPTDAVGSSMLDPDKSELRCRDENRRAISEMQHGRFGNASTLFNQAALDCQARDVSDAHIGGASDEYRDNIRNAELADAEAALDLGYRAEQRGDLAAASDSYLRGIQAAQNAGARDLAQKIAGYNDQLVARTGGAGVKSTNTVCANVNGQTICR
jgi:hypothetical protein